MIVCGERDPQALASEQSCRWTTVALSGEFIVPGVVGLWLLGGHQLFSAGWHLLIYKRTSAKSLGPLDPETVLSGAATRTAVIKVVVLCVLVLGGFVAWVIYRVAALTWRGATLGK
jgi:hypothetical protein